MKTYNITPKPTQVADFTFSAISLGEYGRGRILKNVACPEAFEYLKPGTTKSGNPRLDGTKDNSGWVARISTEGAYIRGANGNVSVAPAFKDSIEVIARGRGAFGAAGRTGNWDDLIIATHMDELWLRVKPSRGPAYILVFSEEKVSKLSFEEAELLDLDFHGATATSLGELIRL